MMGRILYMSFIVIFVVIISVCISDAMNAKDDITSEPAQTYIEPAAPEALMTPDDFTQYDDSFLEGTEDTPHTLVNCVIEENQVLLNEEGVIIKTLKFENEDIVGPIIWLRIENKNDRELILSSEYVVINGIMMSGDLTGQVAANSTGDAFIWFIDDPFVAYGIDTIADIQIVFEMLEPETFEPYFSSDVIDIHTAKSGEYEQKYDSSGSLVFQDENFKVVFQGISDSHGLDPTLHFYIENNFNKPVVVSTGEFSLNNGKQEYSPLLWCNVLPHTKAYATVTLLSNEMQLSTSELKNMAFNIEFIEPNTYEVYVDFGPIFLELGALQSSTNAIGSL